MFGPFENTYLTLDLCYGQSCVWTLFVTFSFLTLDIEVFVSFCVSLSLLSVSVFFGQFCVSSSVFVPVFFLMYLPCYVL